MASLIWHHRAWRAKRGARPTAPKAAQARYSKRARLPLMLPLMLPLILPLIAKSRLP